MAQVFRNSAKGFDLCLPSVQACLEEHSNMLNETSKWKLKRQMGPYGVGTY